MRQLTREKNSEKKLDTRPETVSIGRLGVVLQGNSLDEGTTRRLYAINLQQGQGLYREGTAKQGMDR